MSTRVVPLKLARLVSLFLAFAFGTIGGSVGLNGLIKYVLLVKQRSTGPHKLTFVRSHLRSNQSKSTLRQVLPAGITVAIGINGAFFPPQSLPTRY